MKYIKLKYVTRGRRTNKIRTQGFMGPARSPMGKGPLKVGNDYLRPGSLTSAFNLEIPVDGFCEVVDCQHNRVILRKATKSRTVFEDVKVRNDKTGKYTTERKEFEVAPSFKVIDETPIHEDIISDNPLGDSVEVLALKKKIADLEKANGTVTPVEDKPNIAPAPNATESGDVAVEFEEEEYIPPTKSELTKSRFKRKAAPANPTPIT